MKASALADILDFNPGTHIQNSKLEETVYKIFCKML